MIRTLASRERTGVQLGAKHIYIRAGRPTCDGCVERAQQTLLEECLKPASFAT